VNNKDIKDILEQLKFLIDKVEKSIDKPKDAQPENPYKYWPETWPNPPKDWPSQTWPVSPQNFCRTCGMNYANAMYYVCNRNDCPSKITW